jgi:hypothetical protein
MMTQTGQSFDRITLILAPLSPLYIMFGEPFHKQTTILLRRLRQPESIAFYLYPGPKMAYGYGGYPDEATAFAGGSKRGGVN